MYFLLIFCGSNGFDDIAVNVTSLEKLLVLASDILDISSQDVSLFLFVDGTLIDGNEYLKTLPVWSQLLICKPCQEKRLLNYLALREQMTWYVSKD